MISSPDILEPLNCLHCVISFHANENQGQAHTFEKQISSSYGP
jgi:hypothetical protein